MTFERLRQELLNLKQSGSESKFQEALNLLKEWERQTHQTLSSYVEEEGVVPVMEQLMESSSWDLLRAWLVIGGPYPKSWIIETPEGSRLSEFGTLQLNGWSSTFLSGQKQSEQYEDQYQVGMLMAKRGLPPPILDPNIDLGSLCRNLVVWYLSGEITPREKSGDFLQKLVWFGWNFKELPYHSYAGIEPCRVPVFKGIEMSMGTQSVHELKEALTLWEEQAVLNQSVSALPLEKREPRARL